MSSCESSVCVRKAHRTQFSFLSHRLCASKPPFLGGGETSPVTRMPASLEGCDASGFVVSVLPRYLYGCLFIWCGRNDNVTGTVWF